MILILPKIGIKPGFGKYQFILVINHPRTWNGGPYLCQDKNPPLNNV